MKIIKFPITEKSFELELGFGFYDVYFTGGWYIENLEEIDIHLINAVTSEDVPFESKSIFGLRKQDYIHKQQAVLACSFNLRQYTRLQLVINNPEILIMKRYHPMLILQNLMFGRTIPIEDINVVIK